MFGTSNYGRNGLEELTKDFLQECDNFVNVAFKASGSTFMEAISGLDAETGAMFGAGIKLYNNAKNHVLLQANIMDNMFSELKELKEMNEKLRKQNVEMQQLLRDIYRLVNKEDDKKD